MGNQRRNDVRAAAAGVALGLPGDLTGGLFPNALIAVVQTIYKGAHDFGIADAIELPTQLTQGFRTALGIASRLRNIDEVSNFAGVCIAALDLDFAAALRAATG